VRPTYATRSILLRSEAQRDLAFAMLSNIPLDSDKPLELIVREESKSRSLSQNAAYWAGPLRDIAEQAWSGGRIYVAEIWHEHGKREFLPDEDDPNLAKLVKNPQTYRKWDLTPKGARVLIGSTTDLTEYGFSLYMLQIEALGSGLGVQFHTVRQAA